MQPAALPPAAQPPTAPPAAQPTGRPTKPQDPWTIERVTRATLAQAQTFIQTSRAALFPALSGEKHDSFLSQSDCRLLGTSCILIARAGGTGAVVAAIAYTPFDYRFEQLPWPVGRETVQSVRREWETVEVVRLYVLPEYRRRGVAAALFWALHEHAVAAGVRLMYLHSHPFLPGAIRFWEKLGFDIICVDDDETWRTHHMLLKLPRKLPPKTC